MFLLTILTIIHNVSFARDFILGGILDGTSETWEDAEALCLSKYNTHLASIHSEEDNKKIEYICKHGNDGIGNFCWIGLKNIGEVRTNGEFEWSDGSNFDYSNWVVGTEDKEFPNFSGDCVLMTMKHEGAPWNDRKCDFGVEKYICNAPPNYEFLRCYVGDQEDPSDNLYTNCGFNQNRCLYTEDRSGDQTIYKSSCSDDVECNTNLCVWVNSIQFIQCCCASSGCTETRSPHSKSS
eukprot:258273_1